MIDISCLIIYLHIVVCRRRVRSERCSNGIDELCLVGVYKTDGIYEALPKNNDDNVVVDSEVYMENSCHNIIKLPKDKIGVINGLDGFIVAEKDNVLLICKKEDSSALVRKYVNEIQLKKGDAFV